MAEPLNAEAYLFLKEKGIDINTCEIDFKILSVSCEDLSLYRKAFRVKIRALIKVGDMNVLKDYISALYRLAYFTRTIYGFHSCACEVEVWQVELALHLQASYDESRVNPYDGHSWMSYGKIDYVKESKQQYIKLVNNAKANTEKCVQDKKPFLNLKDKAHFDKCLQG